MPKVLLVDTNFSSTPIHDYLLQSGYDVYVCGGNPLDSLAKSCKNYINIDYSDTEAMHALVKTMKFDFVVPGCNDRSYRACANLVGDMYFGLDSAETEQIINNKELFRAFALEHGLSVPRVVASPLTQDIWPLIVKPVDAYSGRGMSIISTSEQHKLQNAITKAETFSNTNTCIIEEFVQGQLYSHSAFLRNGDFQAEFIVEEHGTANPFVVDTSWVVHDFPEKMLEKVRADILRMAKELRLTDGLIHTQFIANDSSFWLIEVTRRCPGDLYSKLIESSTGFKYIEAYVAPFLNQNFFADKQKHQYVNILRHTISQSEEKIFNSIQFNTQLRINAYIPLCMPGDRVKASPFGRIGLLFAQVSEQQAFLALQQKVLSRDIYTLH
ncbi:ATP-grasp domain-containing protein [Rhodoferax aquaticus]|uniref:ATP-grasp domain-containing protein n=1 Tax=Rhodoferax aquaticus TaxID=2527691 RepID=A0A515EM16_9BURK|nr:ATP-grasp domain-containing protein [Rhodoferax aquaticus]QDL53697.1 ATP-grasp domain-containing protein [Rhodoferax aquaticus]